MDDSDDRTQEFYPEGSEADPDAGIDGLMDGDADDERPADDEAADAATDGNDGHDRSEPSEQDKWRRLAWVALIGTMIGGVLVLALTTFILHEQNDNNAKLFRLLEDGQQQLAAIPSMIEENQKARQSFLEAQQKNRQAALKAQQQDRQAALKGQQQDRQAALESQRQQAQNYRAQRSATFAEQAKAQAEARRADAQAALASAQANAAKRSSDRQAALTSAINSLNAQVNAAAQGVADR
ncbi:MAG: hypothetical protein ACRDPJ_06185, partial [Nocardioidaceae bacterium]